ncbi:MAG: F0F1 ATP synthase subunit B [Candidatus Neomarinimicrobiota bacterium]
MDNPLVQLDPGLFIWTIITFLMLFGLLAKFAWNPLLKMLKERESLIRESLENAEKARTDLEKINQKSEKIISQARSEAQTILAEGKAAANKLKDKTLDQARVSSKLILEDAKKDIKMERDKAISEIKSEVTDLSISIAEKLIRKNLSAEDNQKLIEESLKQVPPYEA